ncbi:DinB family protein [Paenibacillus polygoni]|uniref:DinB family protein n=1 Tax=Paenibacillus polygoni TaxID=3050112 RepID=A0ABY8X969_9BACL|nr:DinB family protein [Paenibacillus polygoni]WIV21254.1 DinB family protein [Paenibacillus polygoni]
MIYDLQGQAGMSPVVGMLYSAVRKNSHRLMSITDGMSQEEVDYKGPDHKSNSTAQLIKHITYVDLNWVYRIKELPLPQSLSEQYGPMIDENNRLPKVKGMSLSTLMYNYEQVLNRLETVCMQLTDADLDKVVNFGHDNEKQATIRWGIWHMADHSRYHQAHINQLRKWSTLNKEGIR